MSIIFRPLEESPLFRLSSKRELSRLLRVSLERLKRMVREERSYREWDIAKRSGGKRHIEDPQGELKKVQRRIAQLLGRITPPSYLLCPVRGSSAFHNAVRHRGQRVIRSLDIKNFFPSASEAHVVWFFGKYMQCAPDISVILTRLVTYQGHLPTGAPTSPILAHFAYRDLWDEIHAMCQKASVTFTMWIDDMTFSGDQVSGRLIWEIQRAIAKRGLKYHKLRARFDSPARVTGVILREGRPLSLPHKHHQKVWEANAGMKEAEERADVRALRRLEGRIEGLRGQQVQLDRANLA